MKAYTTEQINEKVKALIDEANNTDAKYGVIADLFNGIDKADFLEMIEGQVMAMTATIADDIAKEHGVPAIIAAGQAHSMAMAHMALFMFAAGYSFKTDEFTAAENITDADIDTAISQILGGSNE